MTKHFSNSGHLSLERPGEAFTHATPSPDDASQANLRRGSNLEEAKLVI